MNEAESLIALKKLKVSQSIHCRKIKPWRKSTGPKTAEGKKKVSQNLPHRKDKASQVVRNLEKLEESILALQKAKERSEKRQLAAIAKIEKLATKVKNNEPN